MDVIGGDAVVQKGHFKLRQALTQLGAVALAVECKFEQELSVVAPVCHMEDSSVSTQPIGPRHDPIVSPAVESLQAEKRPPNPR
jgi:hypothetical protein